MWCFLTGPGNVVLFYWTWKFCAFRLDLEMLCFLLDILPTTRSLSGKHLGRGKGGKGRGEGGREGRGGGEGGRGRGQSNRRK